MTPWRKFGLSINFPAIGRLQNINRSTNHLHKLREINIYYLFLIAFSFFSSCAKHALESDRPNIVWITSEDNSKHYLSLFDSNGVSTPNIEKLAVHGITFKHAFSNAPVCSVARSTLITGCYAPRIGAQFHRKMQIVSMPDSLLMFPAYLREAGYYTTNNSKEDYNLIKDGGVWDETSNKATWKNRGKDQPFFHVFNIGISHESSLHFSKEQMDSTSTETDLNAFDIQPDHPQSDLFRYTNAYYRDKIQEMDKKVGAVIAELEKDGLLVNTFIFYFGDHGGVLPGSKGYLFETGLHVPLVIYIPAKYQELVDTEMGSTQDGFVSFIDFAPTVLNLAGIKIPKLMDGKAFLGPGANRENLNTRDETFSYADRFDEKYDQVRSLRKGKYKYIRYFQPCNFDGLMNNYRYQQLAYQEWLSLYEKGKLNEDQAKFFRPHDPEALFDIELDPFETKNLANEEEHRQTLLEMRSRLNGWLKEMPDLSFYPEHNLIKNAFDNPVAFGQKHQQDIQQYLEVANLNLATFEQVKDRLIKHLASADEWERYWALIVRSGFRENAKVLRNDIREIAQNDPELINRVRAAEFLGIIGVEPPSEVMSKSLYASEEPAEALLILNSITLMTSPDYNYSFDITLEKISKNVRENDEVKRRLEYLNIL
ncbi:MAG: sulfatase [Saprospiraceae bacterium]|nr:sulfatase [Saprospiraceae bacterium]